MEELKRLCQPLYAFVYKYFEKPDFQQLNSEDDFLRDTNLLFRQIEAASLQIRKLEQASPDEDTLVELWAHKELLLKALVVLTHLPNAIEKIVSLGLANPAVTLRDQLIDEFTQRIVEDPNVVEAIREGRLQEEIDKRREKLFNFKPLFEKNRSYVIDPEGVEFEEIPENF